VAGRPPPTTSADHPQGGTTIAWGWQVVGMSFGFFFFFFFLVFRFVFYIFIYKTLKIYYFKVMWQKG